LVWTWVISQRFLLAGKNHNKISYFENRMADALSAVIVTSGGPLSALAAKAATTTIPILFVSRDPVQDGLVGGACTGFGESRFTPGYASFLRTVPRAGVIRQGRVNPMQLAGLDGPLAELISPCTDPARP
jgi:hypothetical protein